MLDPVSFCGRSLDDTWPSDDDILTRLLRWGVTLRDYANASETELKSTQGAMAASYLTDRRFYPKARRKAPSEINARARDNLPGNYYRLYKGADNPEAEHTAIYLDQTRAHHYHAQHTALPHSDSIVASGRFHTLSGDPSVHIDSGFYGLYYLPIGVPDSYSPDTTFSPISFNAEDAGRTVNAFVYSNEVEWLRDTGFTIDHAIASWGSRKRDTGIPAYSKWAQRQLDRYGDPQWLKPILLATYGVLATRPRENTSIFGSATKGETVSLSTGENTLYGQLISQKKKVEPGFANVIQRGMIEAATRIESLGYASYLTNLGFKVLSIYADAVIIKSSEQLSPPPEIIPWRIKTNLNHLHFLNRQAFISGEMTKLPGVTGSEYKKHSRGTIGRSPGLPKIEAITGKVIVTNHVRRSESYAARKQRAKRSTISQR